MHFPRLFSKERLCLQVLHGKVSAFVELRGKVIRKAEATELCDTSAKLVDILSLLAEQLAFTGEYVSLVLSDPSLRFQMVSLPPMKANDLWLFLQRKALQESRGKALFRFCWSSLKVREGNAVLLQVVPELWVSEFVRFCQERGYQPLHAMTASAAAIRHLSVTEAGTQLCAMDTGASTVLVVRRGGESPILVRELAGSWLQAIDGPMHVAQEIQRTLLFAKQQLGAPIDRVVIRGEGSGLLASVTQEVVGLNPEFYEAPAVWALPLRFKDRKSTANFLDARELKVNSERRRVVSLIVAILIAVFGMLFAFMAVQGSLNQMDSDLERIDIENVITQLKEDREALSAIRGEISRNQDLGQKIYLESSRPFAGWLSGAIADLVPDDMVLTRLWIRADTTGQWLVDINGNVPRNPVVAANLLQKFQKGLVEIPARFKIDLSWEITWVANLHHGSTWENEDARKPFQIRGVAK